MLARTMPSPPCAAPGPPYRARRPLLESIMRSEKASGVAVLTTKKKRKLLSELKMQPKGNVLMGRLIDSAQRSTLV